MEEQDGPSTVSGSPPPGTPTASIAKFTKEDLYGILKTGLEGQASTPIPEVPREHPKTSTSAGESIRHEVARVRDRVL